MPPSPLGPYEIEAFNTAKNSENRIHDDAVARRFGFHGGLVPGVEVYAYMTHLPVRHWGRAWLERGIAECRLLKPVYDRDRVSVTADQREGGLELRLEARGELCATCRAELPPAADGAAAGRSGHIAGRPMAGDPSVPGEPRGGRAISARHPREFSALRRAGPRPSRHAAAYWQLGVAPECGFGAMDACRQSDRAFRGCPHRR